MIHSDKDLAEEILFRRSILKVFSKPWLLAIFILDTHLFIRFIGLWNPLFIPLSMVIIWPLPWLLSNKAGRRKLGFKSPISWNWIIYGPTVSLGVLGICVALAWLVFSTTENNWFVQHAFMLKESLSNVPDGSSFETQFWMVTLPAMIFSPFGEEFLYRGFLLKSFEITFNYNMAMIIQSSGFALAHLAHYGLIPFQPLLILIWLPSMFFAAWIFGWIVKKSESIWIGVISHVIFNFGMNAVVINLLPEIIIV